MNRWRTGIALWFAASIALVPLLWLAVGSVGRAWFWPRLLPGQWSLRAWAYLLSSEAGMPAAMGRSLAIAALVAALAVAIGLPAARALTLHEFPGRRLVLGLCFLPVLAPPLASLMGVHALFLRLELADTLPGVLLAHLMQAVPYATLLLAGSFSRFDPAYEAQARTLGASRWAVWRHVTLPAILPGVAVAAAFAFLISWSQYLSTLLIGGGRIVTLPLSLVAFQRGGDDAVTAALSLAFLAPTLLVFALVARFLAEESK